MGGHFIIYSIEEQSQQLHSSVEQFLTSFEAATTHTLSISISSSSCQLHDIAALYQNARHANKKFIPERNSVIWANSHPNEEIRPEIQSVLNFVENHYREPLTITQVADALYISPSYLMHLFKNDIGKTFNTFLLEYRMEKAKELFKNPNLKVQTVAAQVGYSDVKYFNKLFKKYTSLTPTEYIRIHYAKH